MTSQFMEDLDNIYGCILDSSTVKFIQKEFFEDESSSVTSELKPDDPFFSGHAIVFVTRPELNIDVNGQIRSEENGYFEGAQDIGAAVTASEKVSKDLDEFKKAFRIVPNLLNDITAGGYYQAEAAVGDGIDNMTSYLFAENEIADMPTIAGSALGEKSLFIPNMSKSIKGIQFQNVGVAYDTFMTNLQKSKYTNPIKLSGESAVTFTMTFQEDDNASVTKILKLWTEYINAVTTGKAKAIPTMENLIRNIIDYKSSVYVFLTKPNFREITFFAKYTGVFPTNIPISMLTFNKEEQTNLKLDVEFIADAFTYLDEKIIAEFNMVIRNSTSRIIKEEVNGKASFRFETSIKNKEGEL